MMFQSSFIFKSNIWQQLLGENIKPSAERHGCVRNSNSKIPPHQQLAQGGLYSKIFLADMCCSFPETVTLLALD